MHSSALVNELSRSVSSLQKVFDCPICLDMLNDPVRTTVCGHTFCKKCINRVLKSDCQKKPCPLCNTPLTHRSISDNTNTLKFLQLTLELVTAINLDTGINIQEHRTNNQSTNEASEDSEELFKVKKTFSNKSSIVQEQRKLVSDNRDKPKDISKKENNSHAILKTKNSRVLKSVEFKDYLCNNKNNAKEKNKIDGVNRKCLSKELQKKQKKKLNDGDIATENGNSSKNLSDVLIKKQNSSVINIDVDNNADNLSSLDVLVSNSIGTKKNFSSKHLVSEQNHEGIIDVIIDGKTKSENASNSEAMDIDELCNISIVAQRSINPDEGSEVPKSSCSSEQKSFNENDKEKNVSDNLVIDCDNLSLAQQSNVVNITDKNVPDETVTSKDDNLDQISNQEIADDANTKRNAEAYNNVRLPNCSAVSDGDVHQKSANVNDKVIDKNDDEENVNYNVNVPFKLRDLTFLKDIGELKVKRNQDSISLPFVIFGSLEINLKKRKLDELIDGDDDNCNIEVDDIKKIELFNSPSNLINEINSGQYKSRSEENNTLKKARKSFYPSPSSLSGRSSKSSTDLANGNRKDFIPSQSARTDFDIFDEEKNSDGDSNDVINTWDDTESLSQYGLKSISQMVPQKQIDSKNGHRGFDNVLTVTENHSLLDNDDVNDECCTVINEEIVVNKNKIKVCQREAINFKVPFSKTTNQSLSKNHDSKSVSAENRQNISINEIENSGPDFNEKCLLGDLKSNADLNKNRTKSDQDLCNSNCNVDVSINEIENSEPLGDDEKNKNRFLNKVKQNSESAFKSIEREIQEKDKQMLPSKSSSSLIPPQRNDDIEKECDEIRKRIALFEKELLRKSSEKDLQQKLLSSSSVDEELKKNSGDVTPHADITIINTSDDDDNIDDSISQTPPAENINSSGIDLGGLSSQRDKVKHNCAGNVTIMDSETNEIPSSLNDINYLKSFNSSVLNNARDIIPSVNSETTGGTQSIKAVPDSSYRDKLSVPNSSQMGVNENVNIDETSLVTESNKINNDSKLSNLNKTMKSMSFVYSRLTAAQYQELKKFVFHFNSDITKDIIEGMTTHVIISHEKDNRAPHTYKYLKGVASRLWVVSSNWVSDSLKAGKVLPEDNYLVLDPSGEPGPFRCRQPDVTPPLKNFIIFPSPPFTYSTTEQIQSLILLCGGEISSLQVLANLNYRPNTPRILLMDESSDPSVSECWMEKYHLIIVNIEWLLEVVGQYKLVPIIPYMMAPYSLQLLRDLSVPEEIISDDITEEEDDCEDVSMGE